MKSERSKLDWFGQPRAGNMKFIRGQSRGEDNESIRLEIIQHPNDGNFAKASSGSSFFEPQREQSESTPTANTTSDSSAVPAPEKKLTLFALRLAILEKTASGLGTLGFIWATVVLLGGFAVTLKPKDFWFVTVILLIEGARIFSRSHELEWQHQATTWSLASASRYSFRAIVSGSRFLVHATKAAFRPFSVIHSDNRNNQIPSKLRAAAARNQNKDSKYSNIQRTWHSSDVPILPYAGWVFLSKNVGRIFYWFQLLSAVACAVLSLMRLIEQDYGKVTEDTRNRKAALNIFYALALAEALLFLTEKAYWKWKIDYCKLLEQVRKECDLGPYGMASINRFFYDSYSKCIERSIFDGLKMDLVSFAVELLDSNSHDEHLIGARILQNFTTNGKFASYTLRKIGTSTTVIERLIEMLNWKSPDEENIRRSAAEIVSKLAGKKQSAIRVTAIPGALESISSLLYTGQTYDIKPHEISRESTVSNRTDYDFSAFNQLGLLILKKLASDHDNCYKIGNARGLMPKIIDFTSTSESLLTDRLAPDSRIKTVKRSLQLVKILASTTGETGTMLRKEIAEIVFTVSNIRKILQHGESHMMLQKLGIEVIISLAMDEEARKQIGNSGGMIRLLLSIFFKLRLTAEQNSVSSEAGEALAMLTLENSTNCDKILKEASVVERLISSLNDPVLQVNSSRVVTNLCAYSAPERFPILMGVAGAMPTVLKAIMTEKDKLLEVSIGLAVQVFKSIPPQEYAEKLEMAGIKDADFANRLVDILRRYSHPEMKVPRIRRFVIELTIWLFRFQPKYAQLFKDMGAGEELRSVAETTSELESFKIFSGSVGLSPYAATISSLVDAALELMGLE